VSDSCIHGFPINHCASCRTCPHGLATSRCGRCLAESTAIARRKPVSAQGSQPPPDEEREGWEIFYVPALSGWQVRAPEAAVMDGSYRSLFLARKAVDSWIANPQTPTRAAGRRKS
jgi:hypothetical protein